MGEVADITPDAADKQWTRDELLAEKPAQAPDDGGKPDDGPDGLQAEPSDQEDEIEQQGEDELPDEAAPSTVRMYDFAKEAGWTLDEIYNHVTVPIDGADVPLSKALNEAQSVKQAHDALLREAHELKEKLNQSAVQAPQPGISPEAQAMMAQAQLYQEALTKTDWSQVDPAVAANQKLDLQMAIQDFQTKASQKQMEWNTEQQRKAQTALEEADRQVRARIPEWSDPKVRMSDLRAITDMASAYGFSKAELDAWTDPRAWHLLRDMQRVMVKGKRIEQGAKRIRKVGKSMGGGARTGLETKKRTFADVRRDLDQARKSGSREALRKARLSVELPDIGR